MSAVDAADVAKVTFQAMRDVERQSKSQAKAARKSKSVNKNRSGSYEMSGEDKKTAVLAIVKDTFQDTFGDVAAVIASGFVDLLVEVENGSLKLATTSSVFGCFSS